MSVNDLQLAVALSHDYVLPERPTRLHVLVEVKAPALPGPQGRLPLNLALVLDRSGSMTGEPLARVKQASEFAVTHLGPADYLALVSYETEVRTELPSAPVTDREVVRRIIGRLQPGGATNLSGGLVAGVREARCFRGPGRVSRVLLLTDGLANEGVTGTQALGQMARELSAGGLPITTMGVGPQYDEDLLLAIAEASGGNYYYIDSPEWIPEVFARELSGLLQVAAQGVRLRLRALGGCRVEGILEHVHGPATEVMLELGDLYSHETRQFLGELVVPPLPVGDHALAEVEIDYTSVPEALRLVTITGRISLQATTDPELLGRGPRAEVVKRVELLRSAEVQERAMLLADSGDVQGACELLGEHLASLAAAPLDCHDPEVATEMAVLRETVGDLKAGYDRAVRKRVHYRAYRRRRNR